MFYSPHYVSQKSPMGDPWRVATLRTKLTKKTLSRINIGKLWYNITLLLLVFFLGYSSILVWQPPPYHSRVPHVLATLQYTDGIYGQKMDIFYDDVNRLLVELNRVWKVKPNTDPTLLPKWRAQAKKQAITLPEPENTDIGGDIQCPDFHASGYFIVELDKVNVGEPQPGEGDQHQADPKDITLPERYDPSKDLFNCSCERFEIEGDDDDEMVETREVDELVVQIQDAPQQLEIDEMVETREVYELVVQMQDAPAPQQISVPHTCQRQQPAQQRPGPLRGRRRRRQASVLDNHQTIIPAHVYQSWLDGTSDIVSRRRRNPKPKNIMSTKKVGELLELPASVLMGRLFKAGSGETYYPPSLLEQWKGTHESPSALPTPYLPPEPPSWSPDPVWEFFDNNGIPPELMDELRANLNGMSGDDINMATPGNSGDERFIPSTSLGKGVNKNSSRKRSNDGLEPVLDDNGCHHPDPNFNVSRLSGNLPTLEQELLMEIGPTETQQPIVDQRTLEKRTAKFQTHFETPRGPQVESLDKLTAGKNRKEAALLFYQTCVLASVNVVKVEQKAPYEDILITRGPNM